MSWSSALSGIGRVAGSVWNIADEALDVVGDVLTGNIGAIPGDIWDTGQAVLEETGVLDAAREYTASMAGTGVVANATSTAQGTVGGTAMAGTNGAGAIPAAVNGMARGCWHYARNPQTGQMQWMKCKRRRRRRLLTTSDKADLAFVVGQLGTGQLGRSAISALLSRRV